MNYMFDEFENNGWIMIFLKPSRMVAAATFLSTCFADELVITSSENQTVVINVHPEDSFLSVVEIIRQHTDSLNRSTVELSFNNCQIVAKAIGYVKGLPRNYYAPLAPQEREDIFYILRTLANHSLAKISTQKTSLKKAGERIDHIHPLKYLQFVFSDEELKVCFRNVLGKAWVWKEFLDRLSGSLQDESDVGNLKPDYVQDLANQIKIDINLINPSIQGKRWEELINILVAFVPRKEGADRYHQ